MRLESKRASVPTLYLEMGNKVGRLLDQPEVADRWDAPSCIDQMTIGALAAHLGRAFTTTLVYVHADNQRVEEDISPSDYYHRVYDRSASEMEDLNAAILERADQEAEEGPVEIRRRHAETMAQLQLLMVGEPAERGIEVFDGMVMQLDDYLVTRMVEAVVHSDDLAHSIGVDTPPFVPDVIDLVLAALLGIARIRHGDIAVLRAFARGERSEVNPLPVL